MTLSCWQLIEFAIHEPILLQNTSGLVKICRADDGVLMLVCEDNRKAIDDMMPYPANFSVADTILGFVLDIGIQRVKMLTRENGYYFGSELKPSQSRRVLAQNDFDQKQFEWISASIDTGYQSADQAKVTDAIRTQHLVDTYNNARLLYPNFHSESYLSLIRIIEAVGGTSGASEFALAAARLSPKLNARIANALEKTDAYKGRLAKAAELHARSLSQVAKNGAQCAPGISALDYAGKIVYACMFSAYQYRSKFVHIGFPFPSVVTESIGHQHDLGTAYLHPTVGMIWSRMYRPDGVQQADLIDAHELIEPAALKEFQNTYFHLLPTWYFLKHYAREAVLRKVQALGIAPP